MPNWLDTPSDAPAGARPAGEMRRGPCQSPAPSTQETHVAPPLATTNTSVWLGTPNCGATARPAPAGAVPLGVMPRGPLQWPAPATHETSVAPLLATTNTSVWLPIPNWLETPSAAPGRASPAGEMP